MNMPSPFEMGRAVGGNVSGGIREGVENIHIDDILREAQSSGDPEQIQNIMNEVITRVSPEKRPIVAQALQQKLQQLQNQKTQGEMVKIADTIETENPGSSLHKALADVYRSNLPINQKEQIIKSLSSAMPYRFEKEQRLQKDNVLRRYGTLVKEIDAEIKAARYSDRPKLKAKRAAIIKERDALLNFPALKQFEKSTFNPSNPEHMKKFEELDVKFKGDRVKVNEAMGEEFTL